ncbi:MAG: ABC transporter permease subunit [Alphaproteobacteria bacterium]|jgi:general L-amino acid transport system permease protein
MTLAADAPKESFRLGMLIYDTRYRSITIQVIVLILALLFVAWLVDNTRHNLAIKGKDIDFSFLWRRAGYDIGQTLIPYTNDSTHFRAALVGLVNTIVVAVIASILSTVLGVVLGVLRLSNNWIVSRLIGVYVEMFRNVPLLLWIVLIGTVFSETRPQPKDFKVVEGVSKASMSLWNSVAVTNRSTNIPMPMLDRPLPAVGGIDTSLLFIIALIGGCIWVNRLLLRRARIVQETTGIRPVTWYQSLLVLILPTVAALMAMGFHLEYPVFKGFNFQGGISFDHAFSALTLSLTLYYAAVTAEIVRSGIQAISRGQSEAAFALGLRPGRTMSLIILPQALRVIIPPMISQWLSLTKDTSLGIAVSYLDLRGTLGGITLNQTGRELECMLLMMLIYLILSLIISAFGNLYNASVKLKER